MIPYKWPLATAVPESPEVRLEIVQAMRALAEHPDERLRQRRAEIASLRRDFEALKQDVAKLCRDFPSRVWVDLRREFPSLLSELCKYGYNPAEPRLPAGNPDGGQWTSEGDGSESSDDSSADDGTPNGGSQYAALDTGMQTDAAGSGDDDPISASDIPPDSPSHPVPFVDSSGRPITDDQGNPILRPANLPPEFYVSQGQVSGFGNQFAAAQQAGPDAQTQV